MSMKKNVILIIIIALVAIGGVIAFAWSQNQVAYYQENVEEITRQVSEEARAEQHKIDEEEFKERIKQPYKEFAGPADFGSISFNYPQTWSAYNIINDSKGYEVVFYPSIIPPLTDDTPVALRIKIMDSSYESELKKYESSAEKGELTVSPITIGQDQEGVLLNGNLEKDFTSSFVLLKLRDKTLMIQTDTSGYLNDFDDTILASFKYTP